MNSDYTKIIREWTAKNTVDYILQPSLKELFTEYDCKIDREGLHFTKKKDVWTTT